VKLHAPVCGRQVFVLRISTACLVARALPLKLPKPKGALGHGLGGDVSLRRGPTSCGGELNRKFRRSHRNKSGASQSQPAPQRKKAPPVGLGTPKFGDA
jgi:hypothetical protein